MFWSATGDYSTRMWPISLFADTSYGLASSLMVLFCFCALAYFLKYSIIGSTGSACCCSCLEILLWILIRFFCEAFALATDAVSS